MQCFWIVFIFLFFRGKLLCWKMHSTIAKISQDKYLIWFGCYYITQTLIWSITFVVCHIGCKSFFDSLDCCNLFTGFFLFFWLFCVLFALFLFELFTRNNINFRLFVFNSVSYFVLFIYFLLFWQTKSNSLIFFYDYYFYFGRVVLQSRKKKKKWLVLMLKLFACIGGHYLEQQQ